MSFLGDIIEGIVGSKVASEATAAPAPKWESSTYHINVLGSETCPDCGAGKAIGMYRCAVCARTTTR